MPARNTKKVLAGAGLLLLCSQTGGLHAETNSELAAEIKALKAQIREMRTVLTETRSETRRTSAKVRAVRRAPEPVAVAAVPAAGSYPALPPGAVPAFVTASKQLQFGALTITPGGFIAAESVYRSRTINSDIGTQFGATPFRNSPLGNADEFRFSSRQTRIALLAEGAITPTFIAAGYGEFDFFSATPTANSNQTNSYTPRIRHLYAQLDNSDYGLHVLAGQAYSLLTLNSKGITPRNEVTPTTIDNNQHVGSIYARQPQIRITKDFGKKLWLSLSVEESETTFNPNCNNAGAVLAGSAGPLGPNPANAGIGANPFGNSVTNITCGALGVGGNANTTLFSLNHIPDVIGKVAYEANVADRDIHLEAFGAYTAFYDRVQYARLDGTSAFANKDTSGYGVGAGAIVPLIPRRLDFQVNGLFGRGINRYGPGQLADATYNQDGSIRPVSGFVGLAGLTLHATPAIDLYSYGGVETQVRSFSENPNALGTYVGYGSPLTVGTGCGIEGSAAGVCNGSTRRLYQITGGFWDKLYKGSFGEVRVGAQYSYLKRELFNAPGSFTPTTDNHMVFTSLRYYPFQ